MINKYDPDLAVYRGRAHAMPRQGVSSSFNFGVSFGIARGVVGALHIPVIFVTPTKWKKHFGLNADKEKSRALAGD